MLARARETRELVPVPRMFSRAVDTILSHDMTRREMAGGAKDLECLAKLLSRKYLIDSNGSCVVWWCWLWICDSLLE